MDRNRKSDSWRRGGRFGYQYDPYRLPASQAALEDRDIAQAFLLKYELARSIHSPEMASTFNSKEMEGFEKHTQSFESFEEIEAWIEVPLQREIQNQRQLSHSRQDHPLLHRHYNGYASTRSLDFEQLDVFSPTVTEIRGQMKSRFPGLRTRNDEAFSRFQKEETNWRNVAKTLGGGFHRIVEEFEIQKKEILKVYRLLGQGPPDGVIDAIANRLRESGEGALYERLSYDQELAEEYKATPGLGGRSDLQGRLVQAEKSLSSGNVERAATWMQMAEKELFQSDAIEESLLGPEDFVPLGLGGKLAGRLLGRAARRAMHTGVSRLGKLVVTEITKKAAKEANEELRQLLGKELAEHFHLSPRSLAHYVRYHGIPESLFLARRKKALRFLEKHPSFNKSSDLKVKAKQIKNTMRGIDFSQSVYIKRFSKGTEFVQWQVPGAQTGKFFSIGKVSPSRLGIARKGVLNGKRVNKVSSRYVLKEDTDVLVTKAEKVSDFWSLDRAKKASHRKRVRTPGGATQYILDPGTVRLRK